MHPASLSPEICCCPQEAARQVERSAAAEHRDSFVFEELHTPAHPRLVRLKNAEASPTCEPPPSA